MAIRWPLRLCAIFCLFAVATFPCASAQKPSDPWLTVSAPKGHSNGKTVVLISGDEEYRSEESLPQLARILATRHGFNCIVLFAVDPKDGKICPNVNNNIPGLEHLKRADLMIILTRWRNLPDDQMKWIAEYVESGKPVIGIRTATHAFNLKNSAFQKYTWDNKTTEYEGGFGRQVLGETWIAHHGNHGKEATRGVLAADQMTNPILTGLDAQSIFVPTDVYEVRLPLPGDSVPLVFGQVLESMEETSKPVEGPKNSPMLPIAWTRTYRGTAGRSARVFTTTMGSALDLQREGVRRLLVNAVYWSLGLEKKITPGLNVDTVGEYSPSPFSFRSLESWKPGKTPSEM